MQPPRVRPQPGQESVWDYPRPPRLEPVKQRLRVVCGGVTIADTTRGMRVLETSHPPVYYFPPEDVKRECLVPAQGESLCEWKGVAHYCSVSAGGREAPHAAWYYPDPVPAFAAIRNYIAFYPQPMDACLVDDEQVMPQPGRFYGGWITRNIVGPFKGEPGTQRW